MFIRFPLFLNLKQNVLSNSFRARVLKYNLCTKASDSDKKLEYLLILDFEATCEKKQKIIQEIIEFPCLKININNFKEEGRFHHYVKPLINPILSNFCIELTGILQEMVENEKTFPEVYNLFKKWREDEGLTEENSLYVTSGDWDLGYMMPKQCQLSELQLPSHMTQWIDIKKLYGNLNKTYIDNLIQIIQKLGLTFEGQQHSGICDCINIFNVVKKLAVMGSDFKPTSKLIFYKNFHKVEILNSPRSVSSKQEGNFYNF